jgi:acyl-CoA thioesterase
MAATDRPDDTAQLLAERAVGAMYERDAASRALGIRILEVRPDLIRAGMSVRADMVNGHDLCHGGFIFTFADSAFAFCCNSHNVVTVGGSASIDFLAPARKGDELTAVAKMISRSRRSGLCDVVVSSQRGETIAQFRGRSVQLEGTVAQER